jgi:two-component sensor histidine kinase
VVDVTARRQAAERERILDNEVNHRARNALALVQSTLRMTRAADVASYTQLVEGRVSAMLRVQRLLARHGWAATDLEALVRTQLAGLAPRAAWEGPGIAVIHTAAQPIGMVLHELVINALRHGALAAAGGHVSLRWHVADGVLRLVWTESGGPRVSMPERRGFGIRLIESSLRTQLRGQVTWVWRPAGLVCEIELPLEKVAGPAAAREVGTGMARSRDDR